MKWCKNIYVTNGVAEKKKKILRRLKAGKLQFSVYAITLPMVPGGIMEIHPAYVFVQRLYKKRQVYVIGLAEGRKEAYELAGQIAMECYVKNKNFDIKTFIYERQE